jgi:hypothetical protein
MSFTLTDLFADLFEQKTRVLCLYARLPIGDAYKQTQLQSRHCLVSWLVGSQHYQGGNADEVTGEISSI